MTPEALHLLKTEPELCRDVALALRKSEGISRPDNEYFKNLWNYFIKHLKND